MKCQNLNVLNSIESEERRDRFENDCFAIKKSTKSINIMSKEKPVNYDTIEDE